MSNFSGVRITDAGQALLAGVLAGSTITFTKLVIGDGTMPQTQTPATMTAVVSPRLEASITSLASDPGGGTATVSARFSNESITSPIVWRELGLYAEGLDGQEALYSYGYDATPDTIPAAGPSAVESVLSLAVTIRNDMEFTATFDPSFVANVDRIEETAISGMWGEDVDPTTGKSQNYLDQPGLSALVAEIEAKVPELSPPTQVDGTTIVRDEETGTISVGDLGVGTGQIADGSVTHDKLADDAIQADNLDLSSVTPGAIGAANASHTHDAGDIVTGAVPIEHGGTGATTIDGARTTLFNFPDNDELLAYLGLS